MSDKAEKISSAGKKVIRYFLLITSTVKPLWSIRWPVAYTACAALSFTALHAAYVITQAMQDQYWFTTQLV